MSGVCFAFHLPPVRSIRARAGDWARAPRGCKVYVGYDGDVEVTSFDGLETYAIERVLETAASFLREIDSNMPPLTIPARITLPEGRGPPIAYAISLGARVSIARTAHAPFIEKEPA